jgi:hypothetical protein
MCQLKEYKILKYPVQIPGFEGHTIEVATPGLFSGVKLLVNNQPAPRGPKRNQMLLKRNDGSEVVATWKPQLLGFDIPQLVVEGKTFQVVEPLKWYEWVWGGLPILLLFVGGALGALAGLIGFAINARIFRSSLNGLVKYILSAAVSLLAVFVYFVVAILISNAINQ